MVLVAVALVLATLAVACGSDGAPNDVEGATSTSDPTTTASSATTEDPEAAQRQAVIDAYRAAEEAAIAASAPPVPNPDHPDLLATHTGPMLEQRQDVFGGLRAIGRAIRYPPDSKYREEVESLEFDGEDVAILQVCAVDDGERIVVQTGEVIASGLSTGELTAAMQRVDGVWKLAERRKDREWEGEAGCAID
jgi:hypothetical protein